MRDLTSEHIFTEVLTRVFTLLIAIPLVWLFACGKDESVTPDHAVPQGGQNAPASTSMTTEMGVPTTSDLESTDNEPIEIKIDRVLEKARTTKKKYADFRQRMFEQALTQAETILCSTFRLQLLGGKEKQFHKKDPDLYIYPLRTILKRQGSQPFIVLNEKKGTPSPFGSFSKSIIVSIPKSEAYGKRSLFIANLTLKEEQVPSDTTDLYVSEREAKEVLEYSDWSFNPLEKCEPSYLEPVANSFMARKESKENMATLIVSSLQNLRTYPAKLETVEREWTRANDLELVLMNIKKNLEFSNIDLTARRSVRGYEKELTEAIVALSRAESEGRIDPAAVNQDEVKSILTLFR